MQLPPLSQASLRDHRSTADGLHLPLHRLSADKQQRLLDRDRRGRECFSAQRYRAATPSAHRRQRAGQHPVSVPGVRLLGLRHPGMAWSVLALEQPTIPPGCRRRGISGPAASSPGSHCRQMTRYLRWHHPTSSTSPPARTGCAVLSAGKSRPVISTSAVSAETSHRRDTDAV